MTDQPRPDGSVRFPSEFGPHAAAADQPVGAPEGPGQAGNHVPASPTLVADSVISPPLRERMAQDDQPIGVVIELRLRYPDGLPAAAARVRQLVRRIHPEEGAPPIVVTNAYVTTALTAEEIRRLIRLDGASAEEPNGSPTETVRAARDAIYRIWPNFRISALITRTVVTTKCQAVHRSFNATGRGLVWAVLDSGIDGTHPHFEQHKNLVGLPHRSFVDADDALALRDEAGHGTHVAGILAGAQTAEPGQSLTGLVAYWDDNAGQLRTRETTFPSISGMAPECKLLSCKVLRADESGDLTGLLAALQYIADLNHGGRDLQVHGVNISVGHPFDPSWFATGLTPVCREVDNLVRSGVLVVVAAGNTGYGYATDRKTRPIRLGFDMTINDPGNAALALTVGSTSSSPHSTGVSYFSSKGPTGDGRMKPDLVAPGERVVSAAAGALLEEARRVSSAATYIENSGTSMAAPHVSGAAAAFLSVHREFIGKPQAVGKALMSTATDLGRAANFQGAGLVDAMRAIQSV
ncbi:S8 family peptidase [Actinoplanes sp. NPDC049599]|uniref:S8 family peptidase n=1 Tax=Actinoplanes sp. NPDC049599 TaxID=3363903 RepID=UPI00379B44F8